MSTEAVAGRIEGSDFEEYNQIATPWQVLLCQMSRGAFHGEADYLSVNGILLYRENFNRETVVSGAAPEGYFVIGGPMTSSIHIDCAVRNSARSASPSQHPPSSSISYCLTKVTIGHC